MDSAAFAVSFADSFAAASAAIPVTCGELVQGTLDGVPCLVSCPIDRYSTATVRLGRVPGWDVPPGFAKAAAALNAGLAHLGGPSGGSLEICSDAPRGRGYGSSTADMGAALYALGEAARRPLSPGLAARIAVGIEPSDSTLFPGLALFDHRGGTFHEVLGPAPPVSVVLLDPGGEVDTLAFNRLNHRDALGRLADGHREAFGLLREGIGRAEPGAIGEAATLSARLHQSILPDPLLERVLGLAREVGALGVCRAHSGTLSGLLFDPRRADVPCAADFVAGRLPASVRVSCHALADGGPRRVPPASTALVRHIRVLGGENGI